MERTKNLNLFQKSILIILVVMFVFFTVAYFLVSSRVGFAYRDAIVCPSDEGGNTVYTGRINGETASFTVTPDKVVTFSYGNKIYGPYTAHEDPSAVPEDYNLSEYMIGVEIRQGNEIFFRGGVLMTGGTDSKMMLFDEDGSPSSLGFSVTSNGTMYDSDGNEIDQMAPSASTILHLMHGPKLTSKGEWLAWFCGVFISIVTALSILFADELFRLNLAFIIRNVERAEPSEWELIGRYISWTICPIMALVIYIMGLTT